MTKSIKVTIKTVYGVETVYPVCNDAHTFAQIAGTKTLTLETISNVKRLGYSVALQNQSKLAQALGA